MTQVTVPIGLGGDGEPFSDDSSTDRDMLGQGYATYFFPLLGQVINAMNVAISAIGSVTSGSTNVSSTSAVLIGTGDKTFIVETDKSLLPGMWMIFADFSDPVNINIMGQIKTYDSVTGILVLNSLYISGTGTHSNWAGSATAKPGFNYVIGDIHNGVTKPVDGTWLAVDNSTYLQSTYPELFAKIGFLNDTTLAARHFTSGALATAGNDVAWTGSEFVSVNGSNISRLGPAGLTALTVTHSLTTLLRIASNGLTTGNITLTLSSSNTVSGKSVDGGQTWAAGGAVPSAIYNNLVWANNQFLGIGNSVGITTTDGTTWITRGNITSPTAGTLTFLTNNIWIVGQTANGQIARSIDNGVSWTPNINTGLTGAVTATGYLNGIAVAAASQGGSTAIAISRDNGATWSQIFAAPVTNSIRKFITINDYIIALFNSGFYYSKDCINWFELSITGTVGSQTVSSLATDGTLLLVVHGAGSAPFAWSSQKYLTYNKSTQFALPALSDNAKQWIKAT